MMAFKSLFVIELGNAGNSSYNSWEPTWAFNPLTKDINNKINMYFFISNNFVMQLYEINQAPLKKNSEITSV
jgi:hypothetical protein